MLAIARILKSYGTDGGLLVSSDVDLESLEKGEPVYIVYDGLEVPFFISGCTPKGNRYILHLTDITSLEEADEVAGRDILADVAEEADGPDFTGWTVYDVAEMPDRSSTGSPTFGHDGGKADAGTRKSGPYPKCSAAADDAKAGPRRLGVVTGDEPIPGNYCIYVGDIMIPLHEDFIVSVDPEHRELILDLPAGLY